MPRAEFTATTTSFWFKAMWGTRKNNKRLSLQRNCRRPEPANTVKLPSETNSSDHDGWYANYSTIFGFVETNKLLLIIVKQPWGVACLSCWRQSSRLLIYYLFDYLSITFRFQMKNSKIITVSTFSHRAPVFIYNSLSTTFVTLRYTRN